MSSLKSTCKSMTQANKFVSDIIFSYTTDENTENIFIKELVQYHPTKNIEIDNLEWLKIKTRPPYNKKALFYKYKNNDKPDDISWKLCIRNLYGKYQGSKEYEKDIKNAFRNESNIGTKKKYSLNNTIMKNNARFGKCCNCNIETQFITTDHYPIPYKKILSDFIENNNIKISDIEIYENTFNTLKIKDKTLSKKWLKYHDQTAKYRLLCGSCNSSFGSYGY